MHPGHRLAFVFAILPAIGLSSSASGEEPARKAKEKSPPAAEAPPEAFTADQKEHWAYQPLERAEPPEVHDRGAVRNPIDRFILAELESAELPHSPEADRVALI